MDEEKCEVVIKAANVVQQGTEMVESLRAFRASIELCNECSKYGKCSLLAEFNRDIDNAVTQITIEWSLDA